MTSKYDHLDYLRNLCKDETPLRGRIALLSFRNEISAKGINTAIMLIEYAQLLALFLLFSHRFYTEQTTNQIEIYRVLSVLVKTLSPGNPLPFNKDGLEIVQRVLEFCFAFYLLRVLLFLYIIWLAWKRKTGSELLIKSWQWIFHLQTKVFFQFFVSVYSNVYEAVSKDLFEFDANLRSAHMALCVIMSVFEFLFSMVLTTQFTSVLPFKRFSASKNNFLELSVMVLKFTLQFLRRLLNLGSAASIWVYGPMNILFSIVNVHHFFQKLPLYNYQALKLQMGLVVCTFTLSIASFANVAVDFEKSNMNFVIITWVILTIFCVPLGKANLEKKLLTLAFEKGIDTKKNPETLVHKIIFIKHILTQNKQPTETCSKSEISHLIWSTFMKTTDYLDFECKIARNEIFMHYLEDLMIQFPKNNFIKLYAAYFYARKKKLYGLSIKTLAELKNSNYPTVVTSKSILKDFIRSKTQSDYQQGAYLFNLYDYCQGVAELSNIKIQMAEQAKLQWALCHEITSVGPDLAEILNLGNKALKIKKQIHKDFKKLEEKMPDWFIKPSLLYAYYNLFLGYSSEESSKYKKLFEKRSQKYQKQFENDKLIPENLFQEDTFIIVVSGEKETAGLINYISPGSIEIFGRNIVGSHASIISPPFVRPNAHCILKSLMGQNALTFQNIERSNYLYNPRGYMTPSNYYLNINPSIYGGLSFIFIYRAASQNKHYILLNEEGEIDSFTKEIGEILGLLSSKEGCYDIERRVFMNQICPEFGRVNEAFNIVATAPSGRTGEGQACITGKSPKTSQPIKITREEAEALYQIYSETGIEVALTPIKKAHQIGVNYRCVMKPLIINMKVGKIITLEKIHTDQEIRISEREETQKNSEGVNFDILKSEPPMTNVLISSPRIPLMAERGATEVNEKLLNYDDQIMTCSNETSSKVQKENQVRLRPHWLKNDRIKVSKLYQQALEKPYHYPLFYRVFVTALYVLSVMVFAKYLYIGVNMHKCMSDLQVSKQILRMAQARNNYLGILDATTRFLWTYATNPSSLTKFASGAFLSLPVIIGLNQRTVGLLETMNSELFELTSSLNEEQRENIFKKDIHIFDTNSTTSLDTFITLTSFQATDRVIEASLKSYSLASIDIKSAVPYLKFILGNIMNDMLIKNSQISEDFRDALLDKKSYFANWTVLSFSVSLCFLVFIIFGYIYVLYLQAKNESNNLFALTKLRSQSIHNPKRDFIVFHDLVLEDDNTQKIQNSSDHFSKILASSGQARRQQRQFPIYKRLRPVYYLYFVKVAVLILILISLFLPNFVLFKRYLNQLSTKADEIYFVEKLSSRLGVVSGSLLEVTAENDTTRIENMQASKALSLQISEVGQIIQKVSNVIGFGASEENKLIQDILYGDACSYLKKPSFLGVLCRSLSNNQATPGLINLLSNIESSIKLVYAKFVNSDRSAESLLNLQAEAFKKISVPVFMVLQSEPQYQANSPPQTPLMNAYAASTGEISILKDLDGYYVYADLAYSSSVGQVGPDTVKMALGLSNSHVLLIDNCLNFKSYNCPYYHCSKDSSKTILTNYPYFMVEAIQASASLYLDNAYFQLQEKAMLATNCSTQRNDSIGVGRYGVIGLGSQGGSLNNFLKNKLFSIFINSDLLGGSLSFNVDYKYIYYTQGNLTASTNWIIPMNGFIQISPSDANFKGSLIFDINADALGFPPKSFHDVVSFIEYNQWMKGLACTNDTFQPTCNYTGYVKDLPAIEIYTGQGQTYFNILPEIYVLNAKSAEDYVYGITLNVKALNASSSGGSYVTSDFDNTIILDARLMSSYYFVFNATGPTNYVQYYRAQVRPGGPTPKWGYVVVVVVILMLIIGCCAAIKKKMARQTTAQAPLMTGDNSNYVNPVVSTYDYQQPGGNNYYQQQQPQGVIQYAPGNTGYAYTQAGGN